ncbi:MAG: undecaprenyl-diphosphate phosphatase [Desulfovibrionales bacterium]
MDILTPILLGLVEGLTEFLPVSSTGHLIIAGHLLDFTGPKAATFSVVIQLGAILAVVVLYWKRFWGLIRPDPTQRFSGRYGIFLLVLTSLPAALLGFIAYDSIRTYLFTPVTVAWALAAGAILIILVERYQKAGRFSTLDQLTPMLALGVGFFQCLSLWPGFSRSTATIIGGMILGADRKLAAEYSFIAAVPIMIAATGFDLISSWSFLAREDLLAIIIGFVVSFVAAMLAIKTFIKLLGMVTLRPFAYYRLAIAPLVLFFWI